MENDDINDFENMIDNLKIDDKTNNIDLDNNCDLILNKMNNIYDKLTKYYEYSSEEISNYFTFLKSFSFQISQINMIYKSSQKKNSNNIFNNYFFDKFKNYNLVIEEKFSDLSSQIQRSIISPFEIYTEKNNLENNTIINHFKKLINKIKIENNNLSQVKKEYEDQKKCLETEKNQEIRNKIKEKMEEQIELYKFKVNEINLNLLDYKNESNNLLEEIINKQMIRNQSIKNSIKNYFDIIDNFFSKTINDINIFKDKENNINDSLKEDHFCKKLKLKMEEIKWELNGKNIDNHNSYEKNKNNENKGLINYRNKISKVNKEDLSINEKQIKNYYSHNNSREIHMEIKNNLKNRPKTDIIKFISNLFSKDNLPENEAAEFFIHLSEDSLNIERYSYICDCFYKYKKSQNRTIQEFLNFNNFTHFSNILNLVIENLTNNNVPKQQFDKYLLLDKILNIGEESVCENTYICSLLSNNKKLKNESLWNMCITYKLIWRLKNLCEKYYSSNSKSQKLLGYGKHLLNKINLNIIDNNKKNINEDDFIVKNGYSKYIPHYKDLTLEIKENICKKEMPDLMHAILKEYISHMANYNYPLEESYKIIESIYYEYFMYKEPELINFYINYSIASSFSVRKLIPIAGVKQNIKSEELKKKIKEIKNRDFLVENKKFFSLDNVNNKFLILKNCLLFLNNKEKIKLINLNKKLYELLRKEIYHHIILNLKNTSFNINEHIQVWKCFLKCKSIYKRVRLENHTYESILKDIFSNEKSLDNFKDDIRTIDLDIPRSPFKKEQEKESSSKALKNILYSFLYINNYNKNNNIMYYQGMNYIVTFLYEMIHNEEDCLLILSGLFYSTEYSEIISKELEKMQKYLYVVERLVYLYLPKIHSHLLDNKLELNFFVNPIFISLFTNIYSSLPENDYSFLLEIWDDFILNGWKTIFTDVLAILQQNENKILELNGEPLIKYLSSGITNGGMFTIYNYDEFKKVKNKFKPSNQLLEILSKESSLEKNIKK